MNHQRKAQRRIFSSNANSILAPLDWIQWHCQKWHSKKRIWIAFSIVNNKLAQILLFIIIDKLVDNNAGFELTFELTNNNIESSRRSNTPKRGKSASPGRANLQSGGGDFSRADSYENFDRAEGGLILT